ncbi:MAG: alpha/beta hydrolase family protein [Bacteroidales bacterium]
MNRYSTIILILSALVIVSCNGRISGGKILLIESNTEKGFNYPYYLFIPDNTALNKELTLITEPNNSGFLSDDLDKHLEKAQRIATMEFYAGNYVARNLQIPLLVPIFPRSESHRHTYTHSLDRDVMLEKNTNLERLDLQLLAMVEDARERLNEMGYKTDEQFFITGFSASGTFANRFAALHPGKVKAVAAGGINGLLFLPLEEINGIKLNYPVGTGDFHELFSKPFNAKTFKETPQFLFMGALDDNDAIPFDDAFDPPEREVIYQTLGREMQPLRWKNCQKIYNTQGVNAQFRTYENIGHEQPDEIKDDILEFFKTLKS